MKNKQTELYFAALRKLLPLLEDLSEAAHAVTDELSDEENACDRVFMLGEVADILSAMCPAHAKVLADIAMFLVKQEQQQGGEDEEAEGEASNSNVVPIGTKH